MTEQRFRGDYAAEGQLFCVQFIFNEPTININVLVNLESYDDEEDFSAEEVITAALREATHLGIADACKEACEVEIEREVVNDLDAAISRIKEREAA